MTRIGLLSDTHSHMDDRILHHLSEVDEIWHAGDIGTAAVSDALMAIKPYRAVFGNIDG
ncbi:MAG: metallophosphoesterase family protein, partial [Flavobacteriales bacterium]